MKTSSEGRARRAEERAARAAAFRDRERILGIDTGGSRPDPAECGFNRSLRAAAQVAQAAIRAASDMLRRDFSACRGAGRCLGMGGPLPGEPAFPSADERFGRLTAAGVACQCQQGCWCWAAYEIGEDARQASLLIQHMCSEMWNRRQAFARQERKPAEAGLVLWLPEGEEQPGISAGAEDTLVCPMCSFDHTHIRSVFTEVGPEEGGGPYPGTTTGRPGRDRRNCLVVVVDGECGHSWELRVQQRKGINYLSQRRRNACGSDAESLAGALEQPRCDEVRRELDNEATTNEAILNPGKRGSGGVDPLTRDGEGIS
jgi:hypothetical protein